MYFKKSIFTLFLTISIFNMTHSMEIVKSTIQEHAIPVAIAMGIGAIGGATRAITLNKMNEYYNTEAHCDIIKTSALSALNTLPLYATCTIGHFNQIETKKIYELIIGAELVFLAQSLSANYLGHKSIQNSKKNILANNNHILPHQMTGLDNNLCNQEQNLLNNSLHNSICVPYKTSIISLPLIIAGRYILDKYFPKNT